MPAASEPSRAPDPWSVMSASAGRSHNPVRRVAAATVARAFPGCSTPTAWRVIPVPSSCCAGTSPRRARSTTFLRDLPPPPASAPVALVALYRDFVLETKLDLILAEPRCDCTAWSP